MDKITNTISKVPKEAIYALSAIGLYAVSLSLLDTIKSLAFNTLLYLNSFRLSKNAKDLVLKRDEKIKNFIVKFINQISEKRIEEIVILSAVDLHKRILEQTITSREAVLAYSIRAATIGKELFLVNDVRFEEAIKEAEEADEKIKSTNDKSTLPPLIGLPFTIKDVVQIKGCTTTLGFQFLTDNVAQKNSHVVDIIRKAGAIIFCLTNVPQGLFAMESKNNVFGNAQNPWDRTRTPGGSSGGCAGAVSSFCSPLTISGDIGGSIRIPASFTGLYGLKPTQSRITSTAQLKPSGDEFTGYKTWLSSPGTIARSFDDTLLFAKVFYGKFNHDYSLPQVEFDNKKYEDGINSLYVQGKKAKIGIVKSIPSVMESFDQVQESIEDIREKFIAKGHEVVEFDMAQFYKGYLQGFQNIIMAVFGLKMALRGEKEVYYYSFVFSLLNKNSIVRGLSKYFYKMIGEHRVAETYDWVNKELTTTGGFLGNLKQLDQYQKSFYEHLEKNQIDAVVLPTIPFPAPYLEKTDFIFTAAFYSMSANILCLSGYNIPVGLINNESYSSKFNDSITDTIKEIMKNSKGLPYSVQVWTLPYQDEKCLRIAKEIDDMFKFNKTGYNGMLEKTKSYSIIKATGI